MQEETTTTSTAHPRESWEHLHRLILGNDRTQLFEYLDTIGSGETARAISRLSEEDRSLLFHLLEPEQAADIMEDLPEEQAVEYMEDLSQNKAAEIVEELPSADQADILGAMDVADAENILQRMDPEDAREARQLLAYDRQTAGGIMATEYLSFPKTWTIADVLNDFDINHERYASYEVLYGYVVEGDDRLIGVIRFRDLLLSPKTTPITQIMQIAPEVIDVQASLEEVEEVFDRHHYFAMPVVAKDMKLMGIIRRSDLQAAVAERADQTFLASKGILGGEELRTMPVQVRAPRRLAVLTVNVGLNMVSASVIAAYQDTLREVIALAVFLPMISDLSGCSGNQAVGVSIRELALGLTKPRDILRVVLKELHVGLIIGIALAIILGLVATIWKDNIVLGLVVGGAMALNAVVAVTWGGIVPLLVKRLGFDPAIISAPLLTTVTDTCGFFIVLSLASLLLNQLT